MKVETDWSTQKSEIVLRIVPETLFEFDYLKLIKDSDIVKFCAVDFDEREIEASALNIYFQLETT